jgi:hypothetical protein
MIAPPPGLRHGNDMLKLDRIAGLECYEFPTWPQPAYNISPATVCTRICTEYRT